MKIWCNHDATTKGNNDEWSQKLDFFKYYISLCLSTPHHHHHVASTRSDSDIFLRFMWFQMCKYACLYDLLQINNTRYQIKVCDFKRLLHSQLFFQLTGSDRRHFIMWRELINRTNNGCVPFSCLSFMVMVIVHVGSWCWMTWHCDTVIVIVCICFYFHDKYKKNGLSLCLFVL